jgi:hypothetical protein
MVSLEFFNGEDVQAKSLTTSITEVELASLNSLSVFFTVPDLPKVFAPTVIRSVVVISLPLQ